MVDPTTASQGDLSRDDFTRFKSCSMLVTILSIASETCNIVQFLNAYEMVQLLLTNRVINNAINKEKGYMLLCKLQHIKAIGQTRTRGHRSFEDIYLSNLCINCRDEEWNGNDRKSSGKVIIDLNGGFGTVGNRYTNTNKSDRIGVYQSKVTLCGHCTQQVSSQDSIQERRKQCLLTLKRRERGRYESVRVSILYKIPTGKLKKEKISRSKGEYEGAGFNDYLIGKLK